MPELRFHGRLTTFLYPVVKHVAASARRRDQHAGPIRAMAPRRDRRARADASRSEATTSGPARRADRDPRARHPPATRRTTARKRTRPSGRTEARPRACARSGGRTRAHVAPRAASGARARAADLRAGARADATDGSVRERCAPRALAARPRTSVGRRPLRSGARGPPARKTGPDGTPVAGTRSRTRAAARGTPHRCGPAGGRAARAASRAPDAGEREAPCGRATPPPDSSSAVPLPPDAHRVRRNGAPPAGWGCARSSWVSTPCSRDRSESPSVSLTL
jgi:hypothetical protein